MYTVTIAFSQSRYWTFYRVTDASVRRLQAWARYHQHQITYTDGGSN